MFISLNAEHPTSLCMCVAMVTLVFVGTLGWTTGLATGECLAQIILESLENDQEKKGGYKHDQKKYFDFPGGIKIERAVLAPSRFSPKK